MLTLPETQVASRPALPAAAVRWQDQAHCKGLPNRIFFFTVGRNDSMLPAAHTICGACPVRQDCLEYAISNGEEHGMWGGCTESARKGVRSRGRTNGYRTAKDQILAFGGDSHHNMYKIADYVPVRSLLSGHVTVDHHHRKHRLHDVVEVDDNRIGLCWVPGHYLELPADLHVWRLRDPQ
jgi:WhiB family redox-sensing transcriptional regulator